MELEIGDIIHLTLGNNVGTFEVIAIGNNENEYILRDITLDKGVDIYDVAN